MKDENNELRLFAADIIRKLWVTKDLDQLNVLKLQLKASIEDLEKDFYGQLKDGCLAADMQKMAEELEYRA